MSAQIPDELRYRGRLFALTAAEGVGGFDPAEHGLTPRPASTACWRGTVCRYRLRYRQLLLDRLDLATDDPPPPLAGAEPRAGRYDWRYRDLGLPVPFTGRMLVGRGDVDGTPYLNMGFWPAWMYAEAHELTFTDGTLTGARDVSDDLAAVRDTIAEAGPGAGESSSDWIARTFSLTFAYSWPGLLSGGDPSAES
ncbi:hypothetical protein [Virgisporangium aurantiacum]|uniref:Uncharacterized protein n=1 Tax=Virgisporangium aurantiacum TaxID=175570 RepID=A0A8J3Z599_9ACTN|nr:hypothetical protein [Virgisporangium aurantiacum]GIJ56707.1 hypothetical protein Vau01_042230 [Virgisporangium aurantiacum]